MFRVSIGLRNSGIETLSRVVSAGIRVRNFDVAWVHELKKLDDVNRRSKLIDKTANLKNEAEFTIDGSKNVIIDKLFCDVVLAAAISGDLYYVLQLLFHSSFKELNIELQNVYFEFKPYTEIFTILFLACLNCNSQETLLKCEKMLKKMWDNLDITSQIQIERKLLLDATKRGKFNRGFLVLEYGLKMGLKISNNSSFISILLLMAFQTRDWELFDSTIVFVKMKLYPDIFELHHLLPCFFDRLYPDCGEKKTFDMWFEVSSSRCTGNYMSSITHNFTHVVPAINSFGRCDIARLYNSSYKSQIIVVDRSDFMGIRLLLERANSFCDTGSVTLMHSFKEFLPLIFKKLAEQQHIKAYFSLLKTFVKDCRNLDSEQSCLFFSFGIHTCRNDLLKNIPAILNFFRYHVEENKIKYFQAVLNNLRDELNSYEISQVIRSIAELDEFINIFPKEIIWNVFPLWKIDESISDDNIKVLNMCWIKIIEKCSVSDEVIFRKLLEHYKKCSLCDLVWESLLQDIVSLFSSKAAKSSFYWYMQAIFSCYNENLLEKALVSFDFSNCSANLPESFRLILANSPDANLFEKVIAQNLSLRKLLNLKGPPTNGYSFSVFKPSELSLIQMRLGSLILFINSEAIFSEKRFLLSCKDKIFLELFWNVKLRHLKTFLSNLKINSYEPVFFQSRIIISWFLYNLRNNNIYMCCFIFEFLIQESSDVLQFANSNAISFEKEVLLVLEELGSNIILNTTDISIGSFYINRMAAIGLRTSSKCMQRIFSLAVTYHPAFPFLRTLQNFSSGGIQLFEFATKLYEEMIKKQIFIPSSSVYRFVRLHSLLTKDKSSALKYFIRRRSLSGFRPNLAYRLWNSFNLDLSHYGNAYFLIRPTNSNERVYNLLMPQVKRIPYKGKLSPRTRSSN